MAVRCPFCACSHLAAEVCGRDTEGGLARARRAEVEEEARVRAAVERVAAPISAGLEELFGQVGRPQAFDRAAYQKDYMRKYMRAWRARRRRQ